MPDNVIIAVLAHNEQRRLAACLGSLPLGEPGVAIHVIVNGSTDRSADIAAAVAARHDNVTRHVYRERGKARAWNRFLFDELGGFAKTHIFVDGDAVVLPGSAHALEAALAGDPSANAVAGFPKNGRNAARYAAELTRDHGLFGDLYALSGDFLSRMKARGIRLPVDLIGDDGLIASLARTDLENEDHWDDARLLPCPEAGFLCEPVSLARPVTLRVQYRRMVNYSVRHFQNMIISEIMAGPGPRALPERLADLYPRWLPRFAPRRSPMNGWFDRLALRRMHETAG